MATQRRRRLRLGSVRAAPASGAGLGASCGLLRGSVRRPRSPPLPGQWPPLSTPRPWGQSPHSSGWAWASRLHFISFCVAEAAGAMVTRPLALGGGRGGARIPAPGQPTHQNLFARSLLPWDYARAVGSRVLNRASLSSGTCLSILLPPQRQASYRVSPSGREMPSASGPPLVLRFSQQVRIRILKMGDKITLKGSIKETQERSFGVSRLCSEP